MLGRALLLLGLALCGVAHAATPPRIELSLTPAWKGWARPGRATEIDVRVGADAATRARLELVAGRQSVRADLELQPGRVLRLHLPANAVEGLVATMAAAQGPTRRHEIAISPSESPLLGVGLASDHNVRLPGFHSVALTADDLPRNVAAYASIDALILDAPTLGALDPSQLEALLSHAAACGRVVVVNPDPRLRRVLEGAGACGGQALMTAATLDVARDLLESSLATNLPAALPPTGIGEPTRPEHVIWNRVAIGLAVYFAGAVLALLFSVSWPVWVLAPALAVVAMLTLLHWMPSSSQLVVWSEGQSGAQLARYQAWQRFPGLERARARVPIPPRLASSAQPCDPAQPMRLDFDAGRGHAAFAEFETRLFRQVSLCYAGSFPMARAPAVQARTDQGFELRNAGAQAWPRGWLLASGQVRDLPALGPGATATIGAGIEPAPRDAVLRTALARTRPEAAAALWELELAGVAELPAAAQAWLLVSAQVP
ncbi:MAG: hypothetical protein JNK55_14955 [Rubrivivax sp.]|nr:hypothetical protein [Rubrivivax sp.]